MAAGVTLVKGPGPIKVQVLEAWLRDYLSGDESSYLLEGFKEGFRIPVVGSAQHSLPKILNQCTAWRL